MWKNSAIVCTAVIAFMVNTLAASFDARKDFDRLPIPFRAIVTDLETGESEAIGKGLLQDAMRASAAIPFVFQPVEIGGRLYVDGGVTKNLPVDVVKGMGADMVIAVDPSERPLRKERLQTLFDIMNQSLMIHMRKETERHAANTWNARDDISTGDLRKGGGIGLHADTLIGPVRLDLGLGESGRYTVYLSAGLDF